MLNVNLSEKHISKGERGSPYGCAYFLAIKEAIEGAKRTDINLLSVMPNGVRVCVNGRLETVPFTEDTCSAVYDYDAVGTTKAAKFTLDI